MPSPPMHGAQLQILAALQRRNIYNGSVPATAVVERRSKSKLARKARRLNRHPS